MAIDDRPADRQAHSNAIGFRGVKGLENALAIFRINAGSRVAHCHPDAFVVLLSADPQFSWPHLNRAHRFNRIQDQVHDDLLQLNTICINTGQPVSKSGLN
jgi:hypothetical protein